MYMHVHGHEQRCSCTPEPEPQLAARADRVPVARLLPDVLEDRVEQLERVHHVLVRQRPRPLGAARLERLADRAMLEDVPLLQIVQNLVARRPHGRPGEGPARRLRHLLDERRVGGPIDHVVEGVVRAHPLRADLAPVAAGVTAPHLLRERRKVILRLLELRKPLVGDPRRGHGRCKTLELRAYEECLVQILARQRAHADAAVRDEGDEPERCESPERLPDRRARDLELLREMLLPQDRARRELTRDDRLLDRQRDVVGLGALERHGSKSYAGSVRNSTKEAESATSAKTCFAASPASTCAISSRTRSASKRPSCTHDHTCAREISAVAASSIRLSIAAAPVPFSHASRYRTATLPLKRRPSSVVDEPGMSKSTSCASVTCTSSRLRSTWFGRAPRTASNSAAAAGTRSGCATHVPSKPSFASRRLSSATFASATAFTSGSRRDGMNAAMPPIACASRAWQVCTSSSVYARMNGTVIVTCARSGSTAPIFLMQLKM